VNGHEQVAVSHEHIMSLAHLSARWQAVVALE